jgi:hypothetical protein
MECSEEGSDPNGWFQAICVLALQKGVSFVLDGAWLKW